jgi:dethiobiotin synthetase
MIRLGITGTDTGVGKTLVACALAAAFTRRGLRVAAIKPIETGVAADDPSRDGAQLARSAADARPLATIAPVTLPDPLAPLAAARLARSPIDVPALDRAVESASAGYEALLVEGAGGLLVPITERESFATLFARWSLGLVIVAPNRLGTINHVRLTCAAARAAGLPIHAVVLNNLAPHRPDLSGESNSDLIAELDAVRVVELPWASRCDDLDALAMLVETSGLVDVLARARVRHTMSV